MAEWLRRLTRNQFPSGSAGSNPADCEIVFPFPHLWHSNCNKDFVIFHICGTQAIALTFTKHLTFKPAHTLWTITDRMSSSIVGSVVECSPATRAARVRFPDDASYFCLEKTKKKGRLHESGKEQKVAGDGGYRSPYLSHAKRALYHLSYVPQCTAYRS